MEATAGETLPADRERRLALARHAFRHFYGLCFWSYDRDLKITEADIPFVVRNCG